MTVNKAIHDYNSWLEASDKHHSEQIQDVRLSSNVRELNHIPVSFCEIFDRVHQNICLVDASWISSRDNIGNSWSLFDCNLMQLLCGSCSLPLTQSSESAEVEALRMTVMELQRLGYKDVTFCGDLQKVYGIITM